MGKSIVNDILGSFIYNQQLLSINSINFKMCKCFKAPFVMVTHMLLLKKLKFKIFENQELSSELSDSIPNLNDQDGSLTDEEFLQLIKFQSSN